MPLLLPWLAILVLLVLRPNRSGRAWWIWVPLGLMAMGETMLAPSVDFLTSGPAEYFLQVFGSLAFGGTAVWLLSAYFGRCHRVLGFLGAFLSMGVFSVFTLAVRLGVEANWSEALAMGLLLAVSVLTISLAITLAGLMCRKRYRPVWLSLWIIVWLAAFWTLVAAPFIVIGMIANGGRLPWAEVLGSLAAAAGFNFAALLPFLLLSFACSFYRERLKDLLHLTGEETPPLITPLPLPKPAM